MAEFVVIRLGQAPDGQVQWIVVDDDGTRRSPPAAGSLDEAAEQIEGRPVIVLVPATEALTTVVDLYPGDGSDERSAAGFEDAFVVALSREGRFRWARVVSGPGLAQARTVAVDPVGRVFAAGIFMILLRPFKVGDFVTVGGLTGTVKEIGLFVTALDTPDAVRVFLGNGKIFSGDIHFAVCAPPGMPDRSS